MSNNLKALRQRGFSENCPPPLQKIASYENYPLWNLPPLKIAPKKITTLEN